MRLFMPENAARFERHGLKPRPKAQPQDEPMIRRMRAEGSSFEDIADRLRLDSDSVANILGVALQ
jgi:hypothetical protein